MIINQYIYIKCRRSVLFIRINKYKKIPELENLNDSKYLVYFNK